MNVVRGDADGSISRHQLLAAIVVAVTAHVGCDLHVQQLQIDSVPPLPLPVELVDLDGIVHRPFDEPKARAMVLVFALPDCPVANSYIPELNRLCLEYASRGVRWFLVQIDPGAQVAALRTHAREYRLEMPVVWDRQHDWVRRGGATKTPEAAVFSPAGELLYRGRIDDRFVRPGERRTHVTSTDLRDALEAVLEGRPVATPRAPAVGCDIPVQTAGERDR